ncbi:MAG: glycosyltransferase [Gammaproteobacteria bacterium]|nr:glycosyltransferase [Gammaproteobacteria bacterium]
MMTTLWLVLPGFLIWFSILVLPWRPWSTRESLDANPSFSPGLSAVSVLIPARNEEEVITRTLTSLTHQGKLGEVILIDDQSSDETVKCAQGVDLPNLSIISGSPLAEGWSGKLWALEQGRQKVSSEYILLLDADIELEAGTIAALLEKMESNDLDMVSLMAFLRMQSFWELLLMPAFIYFFKLLYPFALSNSGSRLVAAAAGGCILVKTKKLDEIGGFATLKDALIDDCSLARHIKKSGGRIWTGLSHSAISHRCYDTLQTIWDMVARTAYTQLHYSVSLLLLCTLLMLLAFVLPVFTIFVTDLPILLVSVIAYLMMILSYLPTLKYYDLNPLWACTLPVTGALYLCMTWGSAVRHWRGTGAIWKNRAYARPAD